MHDQKINSLNIKLKHFEILKIKSVMMKYSFLGDPPHMLQRYVKQVSFDSLKFAVLCIQIVIFLSLAKN